MTTKYTKEQLKNQFVVWEDSNYVYAVYTAAFGAQYLYQVDKDVWTQTRDDQKPTCFELRLDGVRWELFLEKIKEAEKFFN